MASYLGRDVQIAISISHHHPSALYVLGYELHASPLLAKDLELNVKFVVQTNEMVGIWFYHERYIVVDWKQTYINVSVIMVREEDSEDALNL
jgi:hypothetical protein